MLMSSHDITALQLAAGPRRTAFSRRGAADVRQAISAKSDGNAAPEPPARWEARSATRVLEVGRDQILERSRRIVEAAYALLEQDGLDGVTIRAVLKKTGLS